MRAAEVSVSPDLVQRLLAAQQPDLAHLPIRVMAHRWDNLMYRLGDELAGRLPRRAAAAGLIADNPLIAAIGRRTIGAVLG